MGSTRALIQLGKMNDEISFRQAKMLYHKPFLDAVEAGRLTPCRVENGKTGTRFFRRTDILNLQIKDSAKAMLNI